DGSYLRLYVDGTVDGTAAATGNLSYTQPDTALTFGSYGGSQYFDGVLDEVAVHDEALTDAEVRGHWLRQAQGIGLRVRTCDDDTCGGDSVPFVGADGGTGFYSESCRVAQPVPPELALNGLDCDGDGNEDAPGGMAVAPGRYVQIEVS